MCMIWPLGRVMVSSQFGVEGEEPSAFVGEVVVFAAEGKKVGGVGGSAVAPPVDVVGFAVVGGYVAAVDGAGGAGGAGGAEGS